MLILSRSTGETIHIGDVVTVTVLSVKGGQVRIGINAPKEVMHINRGGNKNTYDSNLKPTPYKSPDAHFEIQGQ